MTRLQALLELLDVELRNTRRKLRRAQRATWTLGVPMNGGAQEMWAGLAEAESDGVRVPPPWERYRREPSSVDERRVAPAPNDVSADSAKEPTT